MSIANYSVVGRILADVQAAPVPPELEVPEGAERQGQLFELRTTSSAHVPPFATSFHFWAHALRDLLDRRGRPDLFEAMATHALCRVEEGGRAAAALGELSQRVSGVSATPGPFSAAYCMIDQDVMASWVAENAGGFVAFFWLRLDWLTKAEPYDPEDDDGLEPDGDGLEPDGDGLEPGREDEEAVEA